MQLTAIVPQLPPAIDGVGDYAFRLANELQQSFNLTTQFIVGNPQWQDTGAIAPFKAQVVQTRTQSDLLTLLKQGTPQNSLVLLHYVPHGYAQKACPFWLVRALEQWHTQFSNAHLLTFFHELYALDWHRPWSSDFWFSPVQQHLTARVAQLSDDCFTSTERYVRQIQRLSQGKQKKIPALPIFSNVGEVLTVLPLAQRQRKLIIFGQPHSKGRIYQESSSLLRHICHTLKIEIILDIGIPTGFAPTQIDTVPIQELGKLPMAEISHILSQSLAGFSTYDPQRLSKSGIFAAYCAHGLLPINHQGFSQPMDQLTADVHYWVPQLSQPLECHRAQEIATSAHAWYQAHSLSTQANIFMDYLSQRLILPTDN